MNEDLRERINRYLLTGTDFLKVKDTMNEDQLRLFVDQAISDFCSEHFVEISMEERAVLIRTLVSAVMSLGPIRPLMEDKSVTEIMINGPKQIYVQREGKLILTDIKFDDNNHLLHTIQKILAGSGTNKRVDESSPYVDFSLPDGSRVNIILPPLSLIGPVMTIRKFRDDIKTVDDLVKRGELNEDMATLLIIAMKAKLNVVFCGSTGAGKTTALNVFSKHIPEDERIITIEDTPELMLSQQHVVPLASKPANIEGKGEITIRDIFINSLRMRPDRVIIGEIRGNEMLDLIESISSGHSGSLAIVHAETPEDCFSRMITMMLATGIRLSTEEIYRQVAKAIDLIVHLELFMDGKRRIAYITDISYDDKEKKVIMRDIFKFVQTGVTETGEILGKWVMDRGKPSFYKKIEKRRVKVPDGFFDLN